MKKYLLIFFVCYFPAILISCSKKAEEIPVTKHQTQEMREAASDFMKQLKSILVREIQSNGVINAVSVCSDTAQILSNNFGLERGILVKRVSFKNRNLFNSPDNYESEVLNNFISMNKRGELNESSEHIEILNDAEIKYIRFMKPIFVQAECLNCHGKENEIAKPVKEIIMKRYPNDKATGYSVGDLRGAVTIKKILD